MIQGLLKVLEPWGMAAGGQAVESQPGCDGLWRQSVPRDRNKDSHQRLTQGALGCPHFTDEEIDSAGNDLPQGELGLIRTHLLTPSLPEQGSDALGTPWGQARPRGHGCPASRSGSRQGNGKGAERGELAAKHGLRSWTVSTLRGTGLDPLLGAMVHAAPSTESVSYWRASLCIFVPVIPGLLETWRSK